MTDPFAALRALADIPDPTERGKRIGAALKAMPAVQAELRQARQDVVIKMREQGMSLADVAEVLGISRARAQQVAEGRSTGKRKEQPPTD